MATFKAVEVTLDHVSKAFQNIYELTGHEVLVGIPSKNAARDDSDINNAQIGYIMEFGSAKQNIPARPFLIPGVKKAEKRALYQLRKAADAALEGDRGKMMQGFNAAGIVAANEVRGEINSNIPPPLAPVTIKNRHRQRGTKMREEEIGYLSMVAKGIEPGAAQTEAGIVSLINTGALRNSITYVITTRNK